MRLRTQNHISAAPKAMPISGPTTTPEIQVLFFDDGIGVDVRSVDCGVLGLEEMTLVEVVAMLEDVGTAEAVPMDTFSTKTLVFFSLGTYYLTGL